MGDGPSRLASTNRVEAFSDGVLAIAITLLVLDLRAPEATGEFGHELLAEWPSYLAYVASFVVIGALWQNHHALFTRIARTDTSLIGRNMLLLLACSVLPFPTAVVSSAWRVGDHADRVAGLALFALVSVAMSSAWIALCSYLGSHPHLLEDPSSVYFVRGERRRSGIAIGMTLLALAIAFVAPVVTLLMFAVLPVFYIVTLHRVQAAER